MIDQLQRACFQLALVSDYRTYRSYILFNYENFINWYPWQSSVQGYQSADGQISPYNLFTSYYYYSYYYYSYWYISYWYTSYWYASYLPSIYGNYGNYILVAFLAE